MLAQVSIYLLIPCTLIMLAGWACNSIAYGARVEHSPASSSAHAFGRPRSVPRADLGGWACRRGIHHLGLRDFEQEGWWRRG